MKVLILCGGRGTRIEKTPQAGPKALVPIGTKPILWHLMKYYACHGFNDFILCLGYRGRDIAAYFRRNGDFRVHLLDTGIDSNTGQRILLAKDALQSEDFFVTYVDGLSNINLKASLRFHRTHKKCGTITVVHPRSPFGVVQIDPSSSQVTRFQEKPLLRDWVNGGFFIFNHGLFNFLKEGDTLEGHTLPRPLTKGELMAFRHRGFWGCLDTYKDYLSFNELWNSRNAPWHIWKTNRSHIYG